MSLEPPNPVRAKPWVEWFANRIDDPVTRLQFLRDVHPLTAPASRLHRRPLWRIALVATLFLSVLGSVVLLRASRVKTVAAAPPLRTIRTASPGRKVWMVDSTPDGETYSNGLRIDRHFEAPTHARSYLAFPANSPDGAGVPRDQPAGIVFHTTESRQAPFEPDANRTLREIGQSLLDFVRRNRSYHFVIDRFGRVFRIVPESDAANHAGYSVWADQSWVYLNLNESFLGVSFETQTEPGQLESTVSPAQIRSAAMLTEMLRSRYAISPYNCVTHAQVSVNPENMRVGLHTDWASSFPFAELGLPDNYSLPMPALTACGFEFDATFRHWAGERLFGGVEAAEQELARHAAAAGVSLARYRQTLRQRYRERMEAVQERPSRDVAGARDR